MRIVEQYLLQLNKEKRRLARAAAVLTALSMFVIVGVSWNLRITAVTIANGATCDIQEHQHTEQCVLETVLTCGYEQVVVPLSVDEIAEEITENVSETPAEENGEISDVQSSPDTAIQAEQHTHTDECYIEAYSCGLEEHIHNISCYADETVDIETSVNWETDLPKLTGNWAEDLVLVAQSQLGNKESERNYIIAADGQTRNGITRYGQWYGNPYGDWSSMFVMFCLNYAQIPQESLPQSPGVDNMMRMAEEALILGQPDSNMEKTGNLLFMDTDGNGNADRMLIITQCVDGELTAIGGDIENSVSEIIVLPEDTSVIGYIDMAEMQTVFAENSQETLPEDTESAENPDQTEGEAADENLQKPEIILNAEYTEEGKIHISAEVNNTETEMYTWQWQYSEDGNEPWIDIEGAVDFSLELEDTEENYMRYYRLQGYKMQIMPMTLSLKRERTTETEELTETEDEDYGVITSEAITPFSITNRNNNFTINVYALPVDANGNRIPSDVLDIISLGTIELKKNSNNKVEVKTKFDNTLGTYKSAFFGNVTDNAVTVDADNIKSVWRRSSGGTHYLAYQQENNAQNLTYRSKTDANISLYLRYVPQVTVTFSSEGYKSESQKIEYGATPTLTEPSKWEREGLTLIGWKADDDEENIYTWDQVMKRAVNGNVTYTAQWKGPVTLSFDMGEYADEIYSIDPIAIPYGSTMQQLPTPQWISNAVGMAFGGWYLNQELTQEFTAGYEFKEDTILYAKWSPREEGYYVYFMDFNEGNEQPLVLMTYGVTEGKTISPYEPSNPPEDKGWDGKWYLDSDISVEYNFNIPVSQMTDYLTGALGRDLYLYPGTKDVCRVIFVTYGTKVDPVTVVEGNTLNLSQYVPQRNGYEFSGWALADGTPVSNEYQVNETTTLYAQWSPGYVSFEAILRIENANDTGMTQADIIGTWYAKAGSQIKVKSTYTGTGENRKGTHEVWCVVNGQEYPVYTNAALITKATLNDVYETYFIYNNTGTNWADEVNWDDVYTGGELPYSTRPISSVGDTIINFDYMRVRNDITFIIPNTSSGGYIDIYKLKQNGLITGTVIYSGTAPTTTGRNVSASGVSTTNIRWSYIAVSRSSENNRYILHDMKYGQRVFEVYPVGGSWLTPNGTSAFHQYEISSGERFSSRRQDLTSDFFSGTGRGVKPYNITAEFSDHQYIALMYAVECLEGETPDFIYNNKSYKVDTELCEVVKHTGHFGIKDLDGCSAGASVPGKYGSNNKYYTSHTGDRDGAAVSSGTKVGAQDKDNPTAAKLFGETYWPYYSKYNGVEGLTTFSKMYVFYYNRLKMNIQFNFAYDADGNGSADTVKYDNIAHGEKIAEYQFGKEDYQKHQLLQRDGYEFAGWLDANGFVLEAEDWDSLVATGDSNNNTMIFIAKWEKISNNIVEYYEDRSASEPFETHYFDDGEIVEYPTMPVYPDKWVWQEYGEGDYKRFDWDVPMYGEYGVQETRTINGKEVVVNVIRIYGTWDESHTRVVYQPNEAEGGITGTAPTDSNEYTIWQSAVSVASKGSTANVDPEMVFAGWKLDRNGVVYQPGDHVPVQWPRTMIFIAQWAKAEEIVYLKYDPNGGIPGNIYPNDTGFPYKKNSTALVWDNTNIDKNEYFTRTGYSFIGWNTLPDGSGKAYEPEDTIVLTEPFTVLYAQWEKAVYNLSLYKKASDSGNLLRGAEFGLYKLSDGKYLSVDSFTTGSDGHISFQNLEVDTVYKLIEEKAPDGYAIITKEIFFSLEPDEQLNNVSLVFYDHNGNVISAPEGVTGEYSTFSQLLTVTVQNLRGYELPATGGTGTIIHILFGLALVLAPFVYIFSQRRKYERRLKQ